MIRLFGVVHGGREIGFFSEGREIYLDPTHELEERLRQIPANSRVGIESLSPEDWHEVRDNLGKLCWENREHGLGVGYQTSDEYWDKIVRICESCDHTVVWIDDKDAWLRYNLALIAFGKTKAKYNDLYLEEGESKRDYYIKLVALNEELYRAQIGSDRIFLIERDEAILRNIASQEVAAVVAGICHTDSWVLNKDEIGRKYGIRFGRYSTENIAGPRSLLLKFTEDATPDPTLVYDFASLGKALSLLERGTFSDKMPDWVGTWDVFEPSRGYFEVFVEEQNGRTLRGKIEDSLGAAVFEGTITPRSARFTKFYGDSTQDAIKSGITYQTGDAGYDRDRHQGHFRSAGGGSDFYMEKPGGSSPLAMSISWHDLRHDDISGQLRLF